MQEITIEAKDNHTSIMQYSLKSVITRYIAFRELHRELKELEIQEQVTYLQKHILEEDSIDKQQRFYYPHITQADKSWDGMLCFSYGEAVARKSSLAHHRSKVKFYLLELAAAYEVHIKELSLADILKDDTWTKELIRYMANLVPFDEEEIQNMPEDYEVQTLWNFKHHHEAQFLFYDGKTFLHSTHEEAHMPSTMDYGYSTVIDDTGKYGIIHNKTVLLSGEPEMEWVLPCAYYYLNIEGVLAEVQKEQPKQSEDFRDYTCDIIDLRSQKVYETKALCGSLNHNHGYICVDDAGLLRYNKIDLETQTIAAQSKPYSYIANSNYSYEPSPVQDAQTKLWGYMNPKTCEETIKPQYRHRSFFNDDYAIINEQEKYSVIDTKGKVIIAPLYETIVSEGSGFFFVKKGKAWAVFYRDKVYVDFFNPMDRFTPAYIAKHLPRWMSEEERTYAIKDTMSLEEDEVIPWVLRHAIKEKKEALTAQKYTLPLSEYIALFEPIASQRQLEVAGLWYHPVKVKKIPSSYEGILKMQDTHYIGWSYPASASMFDMHSELPVLFSKEDGSDFTLGIDFGDLELVG